MITASITETKNCLSKFINLCKEENEIIIITKRSKPVGALVPIVNPENLIGASEPVKGLSGVDETFAHQIDEFIQQYQPALDELSRK